MGFTFLHLLFVQDYLQTWEGTILVVSHDRAFLDAVATDIVFQHSNRLDYYKGNFAQFYVRQLYLRDFRTVYRSGHQTCSSATSYYFRCSRSFLSLYNRPQKQNETTRSVKSTSHRWSTALISRLSSIDGGIMRTEQHKHSLKSRFSRSCPNSRCQKRQRQNVSSASAVLSLT